MAIPLLMPDAPVPVSSVPHTEAAGPVPEESVTVLRLQRGGALGDLLTGGGLGGDESATLLAALRPQVDVRRLPADMPVRFRRWVHDDSLHAVEFLLDPDRTLVLETSASGWTRRMVATPTTRDTLYAEGEIAGGSSLYLSLVDQSALVADRSERIQLVYVLAEIYSYQLDFAHDIHPGDTWRAVWERDVRPDGSIRARRLLVAEVVSQGRAYPAVRFRASGTRVDWFDMEGASLRLAFKRYPVAFPRITSSFSSRRYHPILRVNRPHYGTDFGASRGTPVHATADGTIASARRDGSYGNIVVIRHPGGYETRYAHLNGFARSIRAGVRVNQDQIIGYVGSTGLASAPHLHYEIRRGGRALNPRTVTLPGAPPVPEDRLTDFFRHAADRLDLLRAYRGPRTFHTREAFDDRQHR